MSLGPGNGDRFQTSSVDRGICSRCGRQLNGGSYAVHAVDGERQRCFRCTLMHPSLIRRSAAISLVVGTLLTVINHFGTLTSGTFMVSLAWKIPLMLDVSKVRHRFGAKIRESQTGLRSLE